MSLVREPIRIPPLCNEGDVDTARIVARAMKSARAAQTRWATTPLVQRLKLVRKLRQLISEKALSLAEASASGRQRPAVESLTSEVLPLAEACRFLERDAGKIFAKKQLGRRDRPLWLAGVHSEIYREPLGVVLIIGPGNFPLLLPGVQIIQALAAGNAVLLKPGIGGTPAARTLSELIIKAGFDAELVALLPETSDAAQVAISERPDKVLFTGSAATGEKILTQLARHLIPATLELSGCDAVVIRADADLDLAVKALLFGLTLNGGAICMSPKRVFVHRSIATELEGRLSNAFRRDEPNLCRPLPQTAVETLRPLLNEALAKGAHFIAGEMCPDHTMLAPIILAGVSPDCRLLQADTFAPVLSLVTVADDFEAVRRANDCPFALTASIFSRDEKIARLLAAEIRCGTVTINDLILPTADARLPFGGRAYSGFGVTRGAEGLLDLTAPKVVTTSRGKFRPAWEPRQPQDEKLFQAYFQFTHGSGLKARWKGLVSLIKSMFHRQNNPAKS